MMTAMESNSSEALFERACRTLPGGVNSPVRAFKSVRNIPVFIREAQGAWLTGSDGRRYIDCIGSWGPMILGHAVPSVLTAIGEAAAKGTSFGAATEPEIDMAEFLARTVPSVELSRLTSSGTEAVMGALRVARGFTGRDLVVKCIGAYHGGADYLLVKAGSGLATLGEPDSAGVPAAIAGTTRLVPHNDLASVEALFKAEGSNIAAVIVEPVAGNMGCVPPAPQWLEGLRALTRAHGALLVFDEVMTGFRVAFGGAQVRYGVTPDLTCMGKVVGGGLPLGAYGGRRDIMSCVAPLGPVYQAGTLSGNPVAVAAGMATLQALETAGSYERLEAIGAAVGSALESGAAAARKRFPKAPPVQVQRVGSMVTAFFSATPVTNYEEASACDLEAFAQWHRALLDRGVYWPPSQFEAAFLSLAHDDAVLATLHTAIADAFLEVGKVRA